MDATAAVNEISTFRLALPPIQLGTSGEPISIVDSLVTGFIAGVISAIVLSRFFD